MTKNIDANMLSCLGWEHDNTETIKQHQNQKKHFIIRRNLCEELAGHWLLLAHCIGTCHTERKGKSRYIGSASHMKPVENEDLGLIFIVFEVIERKTKITGKKLLEPKIEVNTWWTNLAANPETVIHLYHKHKVTGK